MPQLPLAEKEQLIAEIRESAARELGQPAMEIPGACLHLSHFTMETLTKHGQHALIQAGDTCWPRIYPEQDDGTMNTHFSYMWDPESPMSVRQIAAGRLPEIHVWVGLPETQELVDLSVRYLPKACELILGESWPGPAPPDFIWTADLPEWVVYTPKKPAIIFALRTIWQLYQPDYLYELRELLEV